MQTAVTSFGIRDISAVLRAYRQALGARQDSLDIVREVLRTLKSDFEPDTNAILPAANVAAHETDAINRNQVASQVEFTVPTVPPPDPDVLESVEKILETSRLRFLAQSKKFVEKSRKAFLREVQAAVLAHFAQNADAGTLEQALLERLSVSQSRAKRIARDQIGKYFSALTQTRHRALGAEKYVWFTAGDERTRSEHSARDGKEFSYANPPPDGHPGEPINCRCVASPIFA